MFGSVMIRKPCLHDGTDMMDADKNRLVEIPPSSGEPPESWIGKDLVSTLNPSQEHKIRLQSSKFLE